MTTPKAWRSLARPQPDGLEVSGILLAEAATDAAVWQLRHLERKTILGINLMPPMPCTKRHL